MKKTVTSWTELCKAIQLMKKTNKKIYIKSIFGKEENKKDKKGVRDIESILLYTEEEEWKMK